MPSSFDPISGSGQIVPSGFSGPQVALRSQSVRSLPASLGKVRLQVLLFEANRCPFVRRTRQVHEFKFTKSTIEFINATNIADVDIIQQGTGIGVSLARATFGRMPTCYADGYEIVIPSVSLADADIVTQSAISEQPSQEPVMDDSQRDSAQSLIGQFLISGYNEVAASVRDSNDTLFLHQLFVLVPGLFTDIIFPEKARALLVASGAYDVESGARSPLEDIIPVSRTREIAEPVKKKESKPGSKEEENTSANTGPALAYVALDNSFVGNLFERLGEEVYGLDAFKSVAGAQLLGENPRTTVPSGIPVYSNLNPGMHATYEKMMGIMPGLDFSIRFQNTTGQFPQADITKNEVVGEKNILYRPAFVMREYYRYLDPLYVEPYPTTATSTPSENTQTRNHAETDMESQLLSTGEVWSNFGVAPYRARPAENGQPARSEYVIGSEAEQFYLAEQPYVIIEIDGGVENRFFISIAHETNISIFEVTSDPEFVPAFTDDKGQSVTVLRGGSEHSRLLGTIKRKGASLLKMDAFEISIQHFFGKLQISIDGEPPVIIERHRWNDKIKALAQTKPLTESMLQALGEENKAADSQYMCPIKLCGYVRVHMGHYRGAFNFSPIRYVSSTSLSTATPITALEVADGTADPYEPVSGDNADVSAISVILRSKGARSDITSSADEIESRVAIGYPGEGAAYWFQSCNELTELIRGNPVTIDSSSFSEDIRKTIPGDKYGCVTEGTGQSIFMRDVSSMSVHGSSLSASAKLEPNPANAFAINITPTITLQAGSLTLEGGETPYTMFNCIRPLCSGFTVFIREDETDRWSSEPVDITNHVMSLEDSWNRQERFQITHNSSMTLYLSKGEAQGSIESIDPATGGGGQQQDVNMGEGAADTNYSATDQSDYLASLQDKYFYVTVYAWRENAGQFNGTMYSNLGVDDVAKSRKALFTGICNDVSFRTEVNKIVMTCSMRDYTMVLEHTKWLNAPFYDAVRDYNVVLDVVAQAGFKLGRTQSGGSGDFSGSDNPGWTQQGVASGSSESFLPGRLVYELARVSPVNDYQVVQFGDEQVIWNDIVLPGKYNTLNEAMFKPAVNESYLNILQRIAKLSGKTLFFDANGVMHFDIPVDEAEQNMVDRATQSAQGFPAMRAVDYFSWTVNDDQLITGSSGANGSTDTSVPSEQPSDFSGTSTEAAVTSDDVTYSNNTAVDTQAIYLRWWNVVADTSYNFKRLTADVFNEIRLISSTPNMSKLFAAHMNRNSIVDPSSPSFIGYKKMFYQQDGIFGSRDTVMSQVSKYTKMFNAPIEVSFNVPGRTGLRPMQIIEFNGFGMAGAVRLLVSEVKHSINAESNSWTTSIMGQYFIPGEKVIFKPTIWSVNPTNGTVTTQNGSSV